MKLVTYSHGGDAPRLGLVSAGGVVDLPRRLGGDLDMRAALSPANLGRVRAASKDEPDLPLEAIRYLPPVLRPGRIICAGANYADHAKEMGRAQLEYPVLFTRFASTQVGHGQPLIRPRASERFDYEGELALVIGRPGRAIAEADALGHVAGYACYNDGSVRDWQRHTGQLLPGKNFPGTGAFGPWLVTADEVPDPSALRLTTRLNGTVMQDAGVDLLIFTIPALIAYVSRFTALEIGDVIVTGTPSGVGDARKPPVYMRPGDEVSVEITGVGVLTNPIRGEEDMPAGWDLAA